MLTKEKTMIAGGPAFPLTVVTKRVNGVPVETDVYPGMSLRDWFAGQMLPKIGVGWPNVENRELLAKQAYEMADAMLAERAK